MSWKFVRKRWKEANSDGDIVSMAKKPEQVSVCIFLLLLLLLLLLDLVLLFEKYLIR